jgi:hypothetical protein
MKSAADIWVCSQCRSINPLKSGRCYRCSTPREVAAAKPEDLAFGTAGTPKPVEPTGTFRASETFALLTTIAAMAFIAAGLLVIWVVWDVASLRATGDDAGASELWASRLPILALAPIAGVAGLLAYAAWISRVVANLTPLGLGYSKVSPTWAFVEPLIPGVNLYALPTRMAEVTRKLGGESGMTVPLLGVAILLFIGPAVVIGVLLRFTSFIATDGEFASVGVPLALIGFLCQSIALGIGLVVVWQIEGLQRRRVEGGSAPEAVGAPAS